MLRRGGTYAVAGHFTDSGDTTINPFDHINRKHITIMGVWSADIAYFVRGRPIVESGKYPLEKMISHKLGLDRCLDAMKAMSWGDKSYRLDGQEVKKIVIEGGRLEKSI